MTAMRASGWSRTYRSTARCARVRRDMRARMTPRPVGSMKHDAWVGSQGGGLRERLRRYLLERRGLPMSYCHRPPKGEKVRYDLPPWHPCQPKG